ncbi:MAG TPA: ATP-binding protein [Bacteroidetes bacterium]|nr:ATP-binding protein [Bacteroidota bacterium]
MKGHYIAFCSKQSLPKIRSFVEGELRALRIKENVSHQLVLAVDEACANSIIHHHACNEKDSIKLTISKVGNKLLIELTDHGSPFPINEYRPKDLKDIIKKRTKGGLGIFLITKIMDKVEIIPGDGTFTYRFTKNL